MRRSSTFLLGGAVLFVGLIVWSLSLPGQTESQPAQEPIAQIKRGIDYAKRKQFEPAQEVFKKVLTRQPENAAAINNLANLDLLMGKYASAMKKYWDALQSDPKDTNIYLNLGIVYYLQMEITPDEVDIGNRKSTVPKQDWKACSEEAFDNAFKVIKSVKEACYLLGMPHVEDPKYSWVQKLVEEAAERNQKPSQFRVGGGRSRNEREIPVYWKTN
jgi:tetratricopeptide (TPR) repeat protein